MRSGEMLLNYRRLSMIKESTTQRTPSLLEMHLTHLPQQESCLVTPAASMPKAKVWWTILSVFLRSQVVKVICWRAFFGPAFQWRSRRQARNGGSWCTGHCWSSQRLFSIASACASSRLPWSLPSSSYRPWPSLEECRRPTLLTCSPSQVSNVLYCSLLFTDIKTPCVCALQNIYKYH